MTSLIRVLVLAILVLLVAAGCGKNDQGSTQAKAEVVKAEDQPLYMQVLGDIETHPVIQQQHLDVRVVKVENGYVTLALVGNPKIVLELGKAPTSGLEAAFSDCSRGFIACKQLEQAIGKNRGCKGVFWKTDPSWYVEHGLLLKLQPITAQTIEIGKPLMVPVRLQNGDVWKGKVRFNLAGQPPPGASIDQHSGEFSWTPPPASGGKYEVTVSAQGPEQQTTRTNFVVTLTWPKIGKEISIDLPNGVKLELALIPAGSFMMGDENNAPVHKVNITKPFYLGTREVTQEQWLAVMGGNPSHFKDDRNPVEQVSWEDCQEFLRKLNEKFAAGQGKFQLPTEAQWEYACRAGSTTTYCFGDDEARLGDHAWYQDNAGGETHPVGEKKPNAWGLYDMHGNVSEWSADWYASDYYAGSPREDPTGPSSGSDRVLRGGCWCDYAGLCRSANRYGLTPGHRSSVLGFRVARVPAD